MQIELAAISLEKRQVMLMDGTLLAIRSLLDADDNQVEDIPDATQVVVVDHRTNPPAFYVIPLDNIEYAPEA